MITFKSVTVKRNDLNNLTGSPQRSDNLTSTLSFTFLKRLHGCKDVTIFKRYATSF